MSDGMSDLRMMNKLAADVENSAQSLRSSIRRAKEGHHGYAPVSAIEGVVNKILEGTGYRLVKDRK